MIINDRHVVVYKVNVFHNLIHILGYDTDNELYYEFEISQRKIDILEIASFFLDKQYMFCGYNNIHYDNPIVNYIIENLEDLQRKDFVQICHEINSLSDTIINSADSQSWKRWKYAKNFENFDLLTMLFSEKKRVGLKEMQITIDYPEIIDNPVPISCAIQENMIEDFRYAAYTNLMSIKDILYKYSDKVKLRVDLYNMYGLNLLSKDDINLGMEMLKEAYLQETDQRWSDIKDKQSPCSEIAFKDIFFPDIHFQTKELQNIFNKLKEQKISLSSKQEVGVQFLLNDIVLTISSGGLHSKAEPEKIIPKANEYLVDVDVDSMYPSIFVKYELLPPHIRKEFLSVYTEFYSDRLKAKREGDTVKADILKKVLNGPIGNFQQEHSWLYSPYVAFKLRMNGQMLILMLAERLMLAGAKVKQINTDGILFLTDKTLYNNKLLNIIYDWQTESKLTLSTTFYEMMCLLDVNNYIAVLSGRTNVIQGLPVEFNTKQKLKEIDDIYVKLKGRFSTDRAPGRASIPTVISKAVLAYFLYDIPVEQTVREDTNIRDFITFQKVPKDNVCEYNGYLMPRINRYYVATNAPYLFKCNFIENDGYIRVAKFVDKSTGEMIKMPYDEFSADEKNKKRVKPGTFFVNNELWHSGRRYGHVNLLSSSGVRIVNNLRDMTEFPKDINYNYYIRECKKIIFEFSHKQLSLF